VEAEVERAVKDLERFDRSVDASEKHTATLGGALKEMEKQALLMSAAAAGAGLGAVKFAGDNEKLRASLEVLLGSAEKAADVFEEWKRFGAATPLSVEEIGTAGKQLLAFGVDAGDVTATMRRLGDVAQGTGSRLGDIADLYGKARVQGRLFTNDINQFQGRGIPIVQALAKELGAAEGEIKELVAAGQIGFPELERAFVALTSNGGQFEGMMEKLSQTTAGKFSTAMDNAQQALASFGDLMLPLVNEVLDAASGAFDAVNNMDEGTKRFVIGMGGVIAVSGPAVAAVRAISAAMTAAAANPYMLAIGGVIAAASVAAGIINKQAHAYEDLNTQIRRTGESAKDMLSAYADGNTAKTLDKETTQKLIELYPSLRGELVEYTSTVDDAEAAVTRLTEAEVINAAVKQIEQLKQRAEAVKEAKQAYEDFRVEALENIELDKKLGDVYTAKGREDAIGTYLSGLEGAEKKFSALVDDINDQLARIGKTLADPYNNNFAMIDIKVNAEGTGLPAVTPAEKKKWQAWYGEITKVDAKAIGQSGERAAELYLDGFARTLGAGQGAAEALGESFDLAEALRGQQDEIRQTLQSLFAINPDDIDKAFTSMSQPVAALVEQYKIWGDQIQDLAYSGALEEFRKKTADLAKTEWDLAREAAAAASSLGDEQNLLLQDRIIATFAKELRGLTADQYEEARAALVATNASEERLKTFDETIAAIKEVRKAQSDSGGELASWETAFSDTLSEMIKGIEGLDEETAAMLDGSAAAIANIATSLAAVSFEGLIQGIEDVGYAFAQGADAGTAFKAAMGRMFLQMLDMLPVMFLQAGLQLILQGQPEMGLAFIAMAGSSAFINGFVKGTIDREEAEAEADTNARGSVYSDTVVVPYARGGSFTNRITGGPVYFRHGGGLGVMGEAGPEAVMPLKRMANGDLGVRSEGNAGAQVVVNIYNNAGIGIETEERDDGDGNRQIDIMIGDLVGSQISRGRYDYAIESRFEGLRRRGR
jgi:tape measure domain-containing protein